MLNAYLHLQCVIDLIGTQLMTISGFTFSRNAQKFYFPVKESIESILPIVDEFIVVVGDCDNNDQTLELIESINSAKIKIVRSTWDKEKYPNNTVYAEQTDVAKKHCNGDWLFYLQNDEVVHENDHKTILSACEKCKDDPMVEGLLFEYLHFWGDYHHFHRAHNWYPREIRVIRNDPKIHSWRDAQSFRRFSTHKGSFDDYIKKGGTTKLKVARIPATIYHYGWVRPPETMTQKARTGNPWLAQKGLFEQSRKSIPDKFDYGPLNRLAKFAASHPKVMQERVSKFDWQNQLQYEGTIRASRPKYKHEQLWYRFLSWIEHTFLNGNLIGGFKNYRIVKELA
ncbi:MAG: glycosyltransferase family 2 protein [Cyclobacteriaceae bacterium]